MYHKQSDCLQNIAFKTSTIWKNLTHWKRKTGWFHIDETQACLWWIENDFRNKKNNLKKSVSAEKEK